MAGSGSGAAVPTLATDDPVLARFASDVGSQGPVAIEGGRSRWGLGGPSAPDTRLLAAPSGIVDYIPDEMTVTVRAGTMVADLRAALAERGQRCALPERGGTVGGAVVVGESDPRALGRGLLRDSVLQVRYVSAEGRIVSGGGPTVKNVSGFDLPRIMVGSLGTLGLLAEVILRTNPIPACSRWSRLVGADPMAVHDRLLKPSAILWDGSTTLVQLEGHEADVAAQEAVLAELGTVEAIELAEHGAGPDGSGSDLPVDLPPHRWSVAPGAITGLDEVETGRFVATVGLGLVFAERPQPSRPIAAAAAVVAQRLKQNFDPTGRLNPGRTPA